jgi:hypothetical protein
VQSACGGPSAVRCIFEIAYRFIIDPTAKIRLAQGDLEEVKEVVQTISGGCDEDLPDR